MIVVHDSASLGPMDVGTAVAGLVRRTGQDCRSLCSYTMSMESLPVHCVGALRSPEGQVQHLLTLTRLGSHLLHKTGLGTRSLLDTTGFIIIVIMDQDVCNTLVELVCRVVALTSGS